MSSLWRVARKFIFYAFKFVTWMPVVFVMLVLLWGYYVYVYIVNLSGIYPVISHSPVWSVFLKVIFLVCAHFLLLLLLASYYRTIFAVHKEIPETFYLTDEQLEELDQCAEERVKLNEIAAHLPVHQLSRSRGVRYCSVCELIKPDRCHHCSICNRCVLKMDHHCPWVNNCVGYSNYKYFVLFLLYSLSLCVWLCLTSIHAFIESWNREAELTTGDKFQVILLYFMCSLFGLVTAILLAFHLYLLLNNKTTLENMQPPMIRNSVSDQPFFISYYRNAREVFGKLKLLALLPVFTSEGDGVVFRFRSQANESSVHYVPQRTFPRNADSSSADELELPSEREPLTTGF